MKNTFKNVKSQNKSLKGIKLKSEERSKELEKEVFRLVKVKRDKGIESENMKGRVRIFARVRGQENLTEKDSKYMVITSKHNLELNIERPKLDNKILTQNHSFHYEEVFPAKTLNSDIFRNIQQVTAQVVDGESVCLFAYGATGTGKTHSLIGTGNDPGLVFLSVQSLFLTLDSQNLDYEVRVKATEIYLGMVRNNLGKFEEGEDGFSKVLNVEETKDLIHSILQERVTKKTEQNPLSSRSHLIIQISIKINNSNGQAQKITNPSLVFVDLAGSERFNRDLKKGNPRTRETISINKGYLLTLILI